MEYRGWEFYSRGSHIRRHGRAHDAHLRVDATHYATIDTPSAHAHAAHQRKQRGRLELHDLVLPFSLVATLHTPQLVTMIER